jgi:hypothetical protein
VNSSFLRSMRIVAWSFLGIRKNSESHEDLSRVKPAHIIAAGIAGAAILVLALILLVNWIVAK